MILRWAGTGSLLAARFGGSRFQNGSGSGEDSGCALVGNFLFGFQPVLNIATTEVGAIVPKGNTVYGRLSEAKQAGRATGSSELQLETHRHRCRRHCLSASHQRLPSKRQQRQEKCQASSRAERTSERRSGALWGMPGWEQPSVQLPERWVRLAQKGKEVKVPSETLLEFRLQQPASLPS